MRCEGCGKDPAALVMDEGCYRCQVCNAPTAPDGMKLLFMVSCRTEREAKLVVGAASFMAVTIGLDEHKWLVSPDYGKRDVWWAALWVDKKTSYDEFEYTDAMDLYEGACQE
jgi:hypothetical protein